MSNSAPPPSIRQSLAVQQRVVGALLRREFVNLSGRKGAGFLFVILEPCIFMLALSALFIFRRALGNAQFSMAAFALSGYGILWSCRFQIMKSTNVISSNLPLFYHRNVRVLDVMISRATIQAACTTASFILLFMLAYLLSMLPFPDDPLLIMYSWVLVQWYGFNLCILTGSLSALVSFGTKICILLNVAHVLCTGGLFMVDWLPHEYREIALLFPMVHATEMMRDGFFNESMITYYDPVYIVTSNIIMSYMCLCTMLKYTKSEAVYGRS
ncbi:ABC transporter permease [Megalodesulfovibrio gigas]|uniref:Putative capsule polysaccharide export inner-membrane protein ctrC n=1 Tax=Megalodesulfovibrio gigas (strain ATCC 19364 / DSM 1382 / NCIMB 9332 / VKM B-1759) TaxID=1121448 RepID=T2G980_MEGG1|nr:ABC transporter permease [Megalodesulfovibrio gigas]AGW12729.1 putative capsule polysaccharide export inner-membrane protein ctrC [Megalodesulfovibrio gigas DSM 1382 = ATCC 19364]